MKIKTARELMRLAEYTIEVVNNNTSAMRDSFRAEADVSDVTGRRLLDNRFLPSRCTAVKMKPTKRIELSGYRVEINK